MFKRKDSKSVDDVVNTLPDAPNVEPEYTYFPDEDKTLTLIGKYLSLSRYSERIGSRVGTLVGLTATVTGGLFGYYGGNKSLFGALIFGALGYTTKWLTEALLLDYHTKRYMGFNTKQLGDYLEKELRRTEDDCTATKGIGKKNSLH